MYLQMKLEILKLKEIRVIKKFKLREKKIDSNADQKDIVKYMFYL